MFSLLLGALGHNLFPCLFQVLEVPHMPWLWPVVPLPFDFPVAPHLLTLALCPVTMTLTAALRPPGNRSMITLAMSLCHLRWLSQVQGLRLWLTEGCVLFLALPK